MWKLFGVWPIIQGHLGKGSIFGPIEHFIAHFLIMWKCQRPTFLDFPLLKDFLFVSIPHSTIDCFTVHCTLDDIYNIPGLLKVSGRLWGQNRFL